MAHETEKPTPSTSELTDLEPQADPKGGEKKKETTVQQDQAYLKVTLSDVLISG